MSPIGQPVTAILLVGIEHVGQLHCQLIGATALLIALQIIVQGLEHRLGKQLRQQPQHTPLERGLIKWQVLRYGVIAQYRAVGLPHESAGQLEGGAHTNAQAVAVVGQALLQPVLHAIALHQQNLGCQRRQRMALDVANRQRTQVFQAVAVDDNKAGLAGVGGGLRHGSEHTGEVAQPVRLTGHLLEPGCFAAGFDCGAVGLAS